MSTDIKHPSEYINKEVVELIRSKALEAEQLGRLHKDQLDCIYKNKWFKIFVPVQYGGLGLTLPEVVRIEEALAWVDGSTAWVVTLCSGAGWFIGFVNEKIAEEFFREDSICIAGSGAPTGFAEEMGEGYQVTGEWKYASGSLDATAFTFTCKVKHNDEIVMNHDGTPQIATFIVHATKVKIHHTWNSMGMVATGSHSFSIVKLVIPKEQCFVIDPIYSVIKNTVYQYPFLQLAETTLTANISGMAIRFLELAEHLIAKDKQNQIVDTRAQLNLLRRDFFTTIEDSWEALVNGEIPSQLLSSVSKASLELVGQARKIVNHLHPYCGLAATSSGSEINRVWRNFHTATQHSLLNR